LAILLFVHVMVRLDACSKSDTTKAKPFQPSFIIGAHNNPALGVENIKAYAFLHGYFLPTLLILHEPKQTWAGYVSHHPPRAIHFTLSRN